MNEIISSILEAESRAETILLQSAENSKKIIADADVRSDEIKERAVSVFKMHRKSEIKKAELRAEKLYGEKLCDGEKAAEELVKEANLNLDAAAQFILSKVTDI